jgi:hypothetical protein
MRGIIVSPHVQLDGTYNGGLDPSLLRLWLLYWDYLDFPRSNKMQFTGEPEDLVSRGILKKSNFHLDSFSGNYGWHFDLVARWAFDEYEKDDPGSWAVARGPGTLEITNDDFEPERGMMIRLINAVPVPAADVPLDRVLAFRDRHKDERDAFLSLIDELYLDVCDSRDKPIAERHAFSRLENGIRDQILAARSANNIDFRLADLAAHFNVIPAALAGITAHTADFSLLASLSAAALAGASLEFGPSFNWKRADEHRQTPFAYVGLIKDRLEW